MRKTYILAAFLFSLLSGAQTVTYEVDDSDFPNPERGFYHHTETHSANYNFLDADELMEFREEENISLIIRVFYLEAYVNSPIAQSYLNDLQTDFNTARESGVKVIVRFAYSDNDPAAQPKDAPKSVIMSHIQQLKSIIYANRDVINSLQVGFIGIYGEWYSSDHFGIGNNEEDLSPQNFIDRQEVLLSVLENFGWDFQVQVRTPRIKQNVFGSVPLTPQQAYNLTVQKSRVGHYNDCFLSNSSDTGTFDSEAEREYLENDAKYTVNGGETCTTSSYSNCSNALYNLDRFSFDFLNIDYYPAVIQGFISGGCFEEIKRRLGYRFELISSTKTPSTISISLRNTGWGHLANERRSYVVYRNVDNGNEVTLQIDGDARLWLKDSIYTITQNIPLLPVGTYRLYLNLPDIYHDVRGLDQRYSVRFANTGVWEPDTGYNDLHQTHTVTTLSIADFLHHTDRDDFTIELFDLNGRRVTTGDVDSLPKGIYVIRKTSADGAVETGKILI